jgi:hypothetical protein
VSFVTEDEIDALVAKGWDWWSSYLHLQTRSHARAQSIPLSSRDTNNVG